VHGWYFTHCEHWNCDEPLFSSLRQIGTATSILLGAFDIVYADPRLSEAIEEIVRDDIQRIPLSIINRIEDQEIINIVREVDCFSESETTAFSRWTAADGRPEKIGDYKRVGGLRIDPEKVGDADIFRISRYNMPVIVSGRIRQLIMEFQDTAAVDFLPV